MSSSSAASFEVFSLKLKYEQVCQKESEAIARNLSLKNDFSSMKLKLATSPSCEARAQHMKHLKKLKFAYSEWLDNAAACTTKPTVSVPSKSFCSTHFSSTQPLMSCAPMSTIIQQHNSSQHLPSLPLNISLSYLHPIFTSSLSTASQPHYIPLCSHSSSCPPLSSAASQPSHIHPTPPLFIPSLLSASTPITVHSPLSTQSAASQLDYISFSTPQKKYTSLTSCSYLPLPLFTSYLSISSSPTPHSHHNLMSSLSNASSPIPHSHHTLMSSLSNASSSIPHSHHNLTSSPSIASLPIPHSHQNLTACLPTASPHTSHSHLPLTTHFLSTTAPVEKRENINQQLSLDLSSYSSHCPILNKSLDSAAPNHPGEGELPTVDGHVVPFLPSSFSASIKSDTFENTTEANGKSHDKEVEILEEDKVKEKKEGDKKEDEEENEAVVVAEIVEKEAEAEKIEEVNQDEEEVVVVAIQPLSIHLNTLDAISGASLTHFSQESSQNELASSPCSSHHMAAYLKLIDKCATKINSPTSSLTSEGSNLENYLLDVMEGSDIMEGSTGKGGVKSEAPFIISSSLTDNPADKDHHMEGGASIGGARKSGNFTAPLHPKDGRGETTGRVIVDSTSLKRRMGLGSSSDDESVVSYGNGNPYNHESPYEQEEDEFNFFT